MFSERGHDGIERNAEQSGRVERIDVRSLADLRDEAHRAGDLERATVEQAGRVERRNAVDRGERDADSRASGQVISDNREMVKGVCPGQGKRSPPESGQQPDTKPVPCDVSHNPGRV